MPAKKKEPDQDNQQCKQKHKNGYTVDAMHIFHPLAVWSIRISFLYIEVFCNLSPDSHNEINCTKDNNSRFK